MLTLAEVRVEIDRVDAEIKKLFAERMMLADNVARVKAETNDEIFKPEREVQIIEKLTNDCDESIKKEYTALIKRIMEVSRKYQYGRTLKLRDCLDVDYTTEEKVYETGCMVKNELYICDSFSKDSIITVENYDEIAEMIMNGKADCGIGIMEEIGHGVSEELHNLLGSKDLYINKCDIVYDAGVSKKVVTFAKDLVVTKEHNRLKILFVCKNRSGSLGSILSMISDYGVNLTEIHSKPNVYEDKDWNYEFMVEMEANFLEEEIQALVFQLRSETDYFKILGSYYSAE